MNLNIDGKWALVCGASKGLGRGCAQALVQEGVNVVITARGADALESTATELRGLNPGVQVRAVAGDITTAQGRAQALAACPQVDILVTNAGGPPPGDFRQWDRDAWIAALDANMLTPIELIKAVVDHMAERGFGRIVNITSAAVKAPIDILGLSNGARSGLTGFVAGLARQPRLASRNVTLNNLLPGPFDTDRLHSVMNGEAQRMMAVRFRARFDCAAREGQQSYNAHRLTAAAPRLIHTAHAPSEPPPTALHPLGLQ
ncbi:MAG: 3-oxoacyl-ACP reductase [Ideonella sp. MAG2]|nr:MAG: 3-oxoacyl-ACP reductase [Ideonella sp. MAG2]